MYSGDNDNNTWSGWFWNKCISAKNCLYSTINATDKIIEYTVEPVARGNLDVAALNFMFLGFGVFKWLVPSSKLATAGTQVSFSLILAAALLRLVDKASGDLLKIALQKQKDDKLTDFWRFVGKTSSITQLVTKTNTQAVYNFSTLLVLGLFIEPAFEWFGVPKEHFGTVEGINFILGIFMFCRSIIKDGKTNLLASLEEWKKFNDIVETPDTTINTTSSEYETLITNKKPGCCIIS